jgi:hypothetical protein
MRPAAACVVQYTFASSRCICLREAFSFWTPGIAAGPFFRSQCGFGFEAEDSPILRDLVVAHHISHLQFQYFGWPECILKCVPEI